MGQEHVLARGLPWTGLILASIVGFHPGGPCAQGDEEPDRWIEFEAALRSRPETRLGAGANPERADSGSIGSELDVVVSYRPATWFGLKLGSSRPFAGPFVMRNLPGGDSQTLLSTSLIARL